MLIENLLNERLSNINKIIFTFKNEIEPALENNIKFLRGPFQKQVLKINGLPITGKNMRLVNESMAILGYKKIFHDGWSYFRKTM